MLKNSLKIALFFSFLFARNARSALNIGVIAPLAGEYQKVGEELVSGVRTAVDEINSQGGLKGEKINLSWSMTSAMTVLPYPRRR